jgi:hypothetical protein
MCLHIVAGILLLSNRLPYIRGVEQKPQNAKVRFLRITTLVAKSFSLPIDVETVDNRLSL